MNYTNLIDSCQAYLLVQYGSIIELIRPEVILMLWMTASHTQVAHAKQAYCLTVHVQAGCFSILHSD